MACSNASEQVIAIASPAKVPKLHSCSSSSTSASAGHWRTRYFITGPTKLSSRLPAKSKLPTTRPIMPSNTSSTCLLHENYARRFLRLAGLETKILLVDDNDSIRESLSLVLEHNGFDVVMASNVNEALKLIGTQTFDVLLSDLQMPDAGDGLTVVSA